MDLDFLREQAEQWYNEGNIEKAKEIYTKGIELGSGYSAGQLGDIYREEGNIEKAKEIYTKGIELGSEYSEKQLNELIKNK